MCTQVYQVKPNRPALSRPIEKRFNPKTRLSFQVWWLPRRSLAPRFCVRVCTRRLPYPQATLQMGRKQWGKNGPKSKGRPRKGWLKDGSGLKMSAAIESSTMDAGCRLYNISLQLPSTQHEEAKQHACKRALMFRAFQRQLLGR